MNLLLVPASVIAFAAFVSVAFAEQAPARAGGCRLPTRTQLIAPERGANVPLRPTLRWSASPGAGRYRFEVRRDLGSPPVAGRVVFGGRTRFILRFPLAEDTAYIWRARAINSCGPGPWSLPRAFRTIDLSPEPRCPVKNPGLCSLAASVDSAIRAGDASAFFGFVDFYYYPCVDNDQFAPDCDEQPPGSRVPCIGFGPLEAGWDCLSRSEFSGLLARMLSVHALIYPSVSVSSATFGPTVVLRGDIPGVFVGLEARQTAAGWKLIGAYSASPGNLSPGAKQFTVCPRDAPRCVPPEALHLWRPG